MQQEKDPRQIDPMLSFHLMKFAFQDYQKSPAQLPPHEYDLAYLHANEELLLHQVILSTKAACGVVVPEITLLHTLREIIAEYPNENLFQRSLEENNMGLEEYTMALHKDLLVETVLSRVASAIQSVPPCEIRDYFTNNRSDFIQQELRSLSHIQLPFDPSSASSFERAKADITTIHQRISRDSESFTHEARPFLHQGRVPQDNEDTPAPFAPGELCQELDRVLFSLGLHEISPVIESPSCFTILRCDMIHPAHELPLQAASTTIASLLLREKQLEACRLWLNSILEPN